MTAPGRWAHLTAAHPTAHLAEPAGGEGLIRTACGRVASGRLTVSAADDARRCGRCNGVAGRSRPVCLPSALR